MNTERAISEAAAHVVDSLVDVIKEHFKCQVVHKGRREACIMDEEEPSLERLPLLCGNCIAQGILIIARDRLERLRSR